MLQDYRYAHTSRTKQASRFKLIPHGELTYMPTLKPTCQETPRCQPARETAMTQQDYLLKLLCPLSTNVLPFIIVQIESMSYRRQHPCFNPVVLRLVHTQFLKSSKLATHPMHMFMLSPCIMNFIMLQAREQVKYRMDRKGILHATRSPLLEETGQDAH